MLISECGRGAAIATVAAAVLFHRASMPLLIVMAVVEETLEVFSTLAERRYLSWLVGHEDPAPALVRMEARTHVMVLAGQLGGLLFTIMPVLPFAVDALSFVISAISLAVIKTTQVTDLISRVRARIFAHAHVENGINGPAAQPAHGRAGQIPWGKKLWNDICASTRWILQDRFARIAILLSAGTTLACQALIIVSLSYAYDQLRSPVLIGLALAGSGPRRRDRCRPRFPVARADQKPLDVRAHGHVGRIGCRPAGLRGEIAYLPHFCGGRSWFHWSTRQCAARYLPPSQSAKRDAGLRNQRGSPDLVRRVCDRP